MELTSPFARDKGLLRMNFTRFSLIFIYNKHRHPTAIVYHMNSYFSFIYAIIIFDFSHFPLISKANPFAMNFLLGMRRRSFAFAASMCSTVGKRSAVTFAERTERLAERQRNKTKRWRNTRNYFREINHDSVRLLNNSVGFWNSWIGNRC